MSTADVADRVHARLIRQFVWVPDQATYGRWEDWRSHLDKYITGETIHDDCDGFALTAALALLREHVPESAVRLIMCRTETGQGHLVCGCDDGGDTLILDNRQRGAWSWRSLGYQWLSGMRMSERGTWRDLALPA